METNRRITRPALYQKVWAIPMSKLAKEFALSDVGLSKICKRYDIPRPGVGYWAKVAHGKTVKNQPLPPIRPGQSEVIEIAGEVKPDEGRMAIRYEETRSEDTRVRQKAGSLVSGASDKLRHPLVIALQKTRRQLHQGTEGWLQVGRRAYLDVHVTSGSWDRALKLMDVVLLAAEALCYQVRIDFDKGTVLNVLGEDVPIGLKETVKRSEVPSPDRSDGRFYPIGKAFQYTPTGHLTLCIKNLYVEKTRVKWSDTAQSRVEDKLGDFFVGLIEVVARLRDWKTQMAEAEIQRQEAAKIRQERERLALLERERIQRLLKDAEDWKKAEVLRSFIAAKNKGEIRSEGVCTKDFQEWLEWASRYADSIDPLAQRTGIGRSDTMVDPDDQVRG
jgi:hypothetical protein